jgi:hypothetical protein
MQPARPVRNRDAEQVMLDRPEQSLRGADLVTIAWSGIGVWRNFGATKPTPTRWMPAR